VRRLRLDALEVATQVLGLARIDRQQLQATCARDLLEGRGRGVDRTDGELAAAYGFAELQQEIVTRRDCNDFGRGACRALRTRGSAILATFVRARCIGTSH
jgi:hypothetical protein